MRIWNNIVTIGAYPGMMIINKLGLPDEVLAMWTGACLWACVNMLIDLIRDIIDLKNQKKAMKHWEQ